MGLTVAFLTRQVEELKQHFLPDTSPDDESDENPDSGSQDRDGWTVVSRKKRSLADIVRCSVQSALTAEKTSPNTHGDNSITPAVAEVVRSTVESAMNNTDAKKELILIGVQEGDDQHFLSELCNKMDFASDSPELVRIGHKADGRKRLLKLTFPSNFDARKFKAKFDQLKSEKKDIPNIRMRLGKTKQEREMYARNKQTAKKLNEDTKDTKCSFSLRENGSIWRFVKGDDGKWKRDRDWSHQGNDQC